jgi:hypothetical protein
MELFSIQECLICIGGGIVKKLIPGILIMVIFLNISNLALANSGPVYWQGYPSSDVMLVDKASPITVESESLVFDFSDSNHSDHSITGKVTASYQMFNPTKEPKSVQMAFPFVGTIAGLSLDDIKITADGDALPYDIYIGNSVNSHRISGQEDIRADFDFDSVVSAITHKPYKPENFAEDEMGKLYIIDVKPTTDKPINLAVSFDMDSENTKVLTKGFNRYERHGSSARIAAWCRGPEVFEILVLGQDINPRVNAYSDGGLSDKTDLYTCQVSAGLVEVGQYLMNYIEDNNRARDYIASVDESLFPDIQLYNLYAASLDNGFTRNMGICSEDDLMSQLHYNRILTLVYTVEFPAGCRKEVTVCYKASGTMDKRQTSEPLYSFDYLLSPAKNWDDFNNLSIEIIPPEKAPYIVKSSVELTMKENGVYTAALATLPDDDLSFTLYSNEKVTLIDRAIGNLNRRFGYFTPLVVGVILSFIIVATILLSKKWGQA